MYILGINMSHDRSVCLLKDGMILVAIAEERLDRNKKSLGFIVGTNGSFERTLPIRSITYCLDSQKLSIDDLDLIVIDHALSYVNIDRFKKLIPIKDKTKIRSLPHPSHHLAHAYSTYFCSPFNESAILVADALGSSDVFRGIEGETGFYALENEIKQVFETYQLSGSRIREDKCYYSLTYIYNFITQALGFITSYGNWLPDMQLGEAGKTMALAAYGKHVSNWPLIVEDYRDTIKTNKFVQWVPICKIGKKVHGDLIPKVKNPSEKLSQFHVNLAYKAQEEFEKGLISFANRLYSVTKSNNLCIAGGAGLNCVANRKILENTPFKNIFIQPAATDDGNAIGCAMYGWHKIANGKKRFYMSNAYLGRIYSNKEIIASLAKYNISKKPLNKKELIKQAAQFIAKGKILGWFQGGSEFGPRALGHRSILADPRRPEMKELLNKRVKHRESFQPYAPSVLLEFADKYFDIPCPSPFMLLVAKVKKKKFDEIPAIIHVDGTARVQTVTKADNGIFYDLIKEFNRISKVPVILNTSFNTKGKPIVETPDDAVKVFFETEMDILVLGNYLLEKESKEVKGGIKKLQKSREIVNIVHDVLRRAK